MHILLLESGKDASENATSSDPSLRDFGQLPHSLKGLMSLSEDKVVGTPDSKGLPEKRRGADA